MSYVTCIRRTTRKDRDFLFWVELSKDLANRSDVATLQGLGLSVLRGRSTYFNILSAADDSSPQLNYNPFYL